MIEKVSVSPFVKVGKERVSLGAEYGENFIDGSVDVRALIFILLESGLRKDEKSDIGKVKEITLTPVVFNTQTIITVLEEYFDLLDVQEGEASRVICRMWNFAHMLNKDDFIHLYSQELASDIVEVKQAPDVENIGWQHRQRRRAKEGQEIAKEFVTRFDVSRYFYIGGKLVDLEILVDDFLRKDGKQVNDSELHYILEGHSVMDAKNIPQKDLDELFHMLKLFSYYTEHSLRSGDDISIHYWQFTEKQSPDDMVVVEAINKDNPWFGKSLTLHKNNYLTAKSDYKLLSIFKLID